MSLLFEPARIKNVTLRNRFIRSAIYDGMSDMTGRVTDSRIKMISDLTARGVGMIISAVMCVHPSGQVSAFMNSIAEDEGIASLRKLTCATAINVWKSAIMGALCIASLFKKNNINPAANKGDPWNVTIS